MFDADRHRSLDACATPHPSADADTFSRKGRRAGLKAYRFAQCSQMAAVQEKSSPPLGAEFSGL